MRVYLLAIAAAAALAGSNIAFADGLNDREAIENAVVQFITGWREGDRELIDGVTDLDHGHAIWLRTDDGVKSVMSVSFDQLTTDMPPHPDYGVSHQILNVNIVDDELAFASIAAEQAQGGSIIDYYILMKVEGSWTIVEMSWLWRPGMQVGNN